MGLLCAAQRKQRTILIASGRQANHFDGKGTFAQLHFPGFPRRLESRKYLIILDTGLLRYDKGAGVVGFCKALGKCLTLTLPRIYSPETLQNASQCVLGPDHLRYLKTVLRLKPGDAILVFDGYGHEFEARIENFSASGVTVRLGASLPPVQRKIRVTLAQGIPKAGKMDGIVRTAAELGTDVIIPVAAARSVRRMEGEKSSAKVARWQKIVQEAARCTQSSSVTVVEPVLSFADMLKRADSGARKLIFWEEEDRLTIREVLSDGRFDGAAHYFIIVGPEGGLTREEVDRARESGFISVSLGRQILKVETAAAAILSIIQYEKGIFSDVAEGIGT
jgi:16S rRNA (uracil1498-N3)-methyltransferase